MTHSEIESMLVFRDDVTGEFKAFNRHLTAEQVVGNCVVLFGPGSVNCVAEDLLAAAPYLYHQLTMQYNGLQMMIDGFESLDKSPAIDDLCRRITELQNGILFAQKIAQEGINKVSDVLLQNGSSK